MLLSQVDRDWVKFYHSHGTTVATVPPGNENLELCELCRMSITELCEPGVFPKGVFYGKECCCIEFSAPLGEGEQSASENCVGPAPNVCPNTVFWRVRTCTDKEFSFRLSGAGEPFEERSAIGWDYFCYPLPKERSAFRLSMCKLTAFLT